MIHDEDRAAHCRMARKIIINEKLKEAIPGMLINNAAPLVHTNTMILIARARGA